MAEHFLDGSVTQPFWDNLEQPCLVIAPGDTVTFDCPEPCGQITPEWTSAVLEDVDFALVQALVGSVFIQGAKPGDALEIDLLNLKPKGWGWIARVRHFGLLADDFDFPYIHHWELEGEGCHFGVNDITLPFQPFCGTMGVAPAEPARLETMPPSAKGGNVDIRELGPGSRQWLPVFVDGALFACGDWHSAQGDGELCGTGIESPMEVTLRFNLRKNIGLKELQIQTPSPLTHLDKQGFHVTTAPGPDLLENAKNATRYMIDWLESDQGLTRRLAAKDVSQAVDLKISEIVDVPNFIVSAYFPLAVFRS